MTINDKYKDLWELKENTYLHINPDMPIVIFMDGRNVTNNHKGFPMLGDHNYTQCLIECGTELVREINTTAIIYAALDEISFIFYDTKDIIQYFGVDDNANYLCTLFMQRFIKKFWNYFGNFFKNTIYNIPSEDISRYLAYRKEICYSGGLWYIAKEFLSKEKYRGLALPEMERLLKKENLWDTFISTDYLYKGYEYEYKKDDYSVVDIYDIF